jgi:general secretion pathway protein M
MKEELKAYLDGLNERERNLVYGGVVVVVLLVLYQLVWSPFVGGVAKLDKKVDQQRQDLAWMRENMPELRELSRTAGHAATPGRSVYSVIEVSARTKFGDSIQVQQEGQKVRVVIANASFDDVMTWLDGLQAQQQVAIKEFNAENTGTTGYIKSTILLEG